MISSLSIVIPNNPNDIIHIKKKENSLDILDIPKNKKNDIITNKEWESTIFEDLSKEDILNKILNMLEYSEKELNIAIYNRNFSKEIEYIQRNVEYTVVMGLNTLPSVNKNPYTVFELKLLNKLCKKQKDVNKLNNYFQTYKKLWFE